MFSFGSSASIESKEQPTTLELICDKLKKPQDGYNNSIYISSQHSLNRKKVHVAYLESKLPSHKHTYYKIIFDSYLDSSKVLIPGKIRHSLGYGYVIPKDIPKIVISTLETKDIKPATQINFEIYKITENKNSNLDKLIDQEGLNQSVLKSLTDYPIFDNQMFVVNYKNAIFELSVKDIHFEKKSKNRILNSSFAKIDNKTKLNISLGRVLEKKYILRNAPLSLTLDFVNKGIGGHKDELKRFVREAFYTRALGDEYLDAYGVGHTKGVLLYGPPGTVKTLIARQIGSMFTQNVKVINGPKLKSKYVGQSQENLRNIFSQAESDWRQKGKDSDMHVFIFDEIDALVPKRGTRSGGTGVDDDMVATLLTMLDGVDSPKNILVIGLTNR